MKQEEDTFKEPEPIRSPRQRQVQSASFTKGVLEQPRFVHDDPLATSQGKHPNCHCDISVNLLTTE